MLIGNGTSAISAVDLSTDGVIVIGDGSGNPTTLDVGGSGGITILGTIATGTWEATDIGVAHGGTGLSTVGTNYILTGNGTSDLTAESNLTFSGSALTCTGSASITTTLSVKSPYFSGYTIMSEPASNGRHMATGEADYQQNYSSISIYDQIAASDEHDDDFGVWS